jgi:hypothetical protein
MRIRCLFWNINEGKGTRLRPSLTRLVNRGLDLIVLAECPEDAGELESILNAGEVNSCIRSQPLRQE